MKQIKISLCVYRKNSKRQNAPYYARMRKDGRTTDIPLNTHDRAVAESWVRLRRDEISRFNDYVAVGETPPSDLLQKLPLDGLKTRKTANSRTVPTLRACLDEWEANLRRRGFSERTIRTYTTNVSYVLKDLSLPITSITVETVRRQMTEHDHIKSTTRRAYFVSYKEFLRFGVKHYGVPIETIEEIPKIMQIQTDRPYWTMTEIRRIIECVHCKSKLVEDCYKAFFWFLATTGARQGEAGALEWSDISNDGVVTFRASTTKGNTMRRVPLEWRILEMISKLPRRGKKVFYDIHDTQPMRFHVLAQAIKEAGVKHGGLHTYRHSASMYLYAHTQDIKATAEMLGHSAATALTYYQSSRSPDQLREMVEKAFGENNQLPSPMDRLIEEDLL